MFYGLGSDGTVSSNKATIKIIGDATGLWAQGHFVYDSKKSGATTVSHLRFGPRPIRAAYQIRQAGFVAVHDSGFLHRIDVLEVAAPGAVVLLNVAGPSDQVWERLPHEVQEALLAKGCHLYAIDAQRIAEAHGLGRRINTVMQTCFFALSGVLPTDEAIELIKRSVAETWGRRGPEVVRRNLAAIDDTLAHLNEIPLGTLGSRSRRRPAVPADAPDFVQRVTRLLLEGHGDRLPVSAFPPDGTWPTGTSRYEKRAIALDIPVWEPELCVQCNRCSIICPHAAIRTKVFEPDAADAPALHRLRSGRCRNGSPRRSPACPTACRWHPTTAPVAGCAWRSARPRTAPSRSARRSTWRRSRSAATVSASPGRTSSKCPTSPARGCRASSARWRCYHRCSSSPGPAPVAGRRPTCAPSPSSSATGW
ncbi:MAG: 2-oxoacid:acceptor oxidoreductase family protein [Acidimicrobiales bacterium]